MDVNLREMGVGDLSVGRKVRVMWEAFHGRSVAYTAAMEAGDVTALDAALSRNVWRDEPPHEWAVATLRRIVLSQDNHLRTQTLAGLRRGKVEFLRPENAS
jgi:cytochrome b pre-mRNA-processing protein 3